jgi:chromosome partitioning protein
MLNTITEGILKWQATRNLSRQTRAKTVAVCSRKGGVGKTTTTVHLAVAAARWHGMRVLVLDMDPQGHVACALSSMLRAENVPALSSVLLEKNGDLLDAAVATDIPSLWVVPADHKLEQVQMLLATRIGREFVLRTALAKAEDLFDLVLIDCPPNLDTLTLNALVAAQHVLIPTDLSFLGVEGVADVVEAVETIRERLGLPLEVAGILVGRVDSRNKLINRELTRVLSQRFSRLLLDDSVPSNTAVAQACLHGKSVFDYAPACGAAASYQKAVDDLLDRIDA